MTSLAHSLLRQDRMAFDGESTAAEFVLQNRDGGHLRTGIPPITSYAQARSPGH